MKIHHFILFLFWLWLIIEIALLLLIWDNDKRGKFVRSGWHGRPFFILFCICFSRWLRSATLSNWSILYVDISSSNILISLLAHAKQIQPSDPPQVEMTWNLNTSCHPEDIKQGVNDEYQSGISVSVIISEMNLVFQRLLPNSNITCCKIQCIYSWYFKGQSVLHEKKEEAN